MRASRFTALVAACLLLSQEGRADDVAPTVPALVAPELETFHDAELPAGVVPVDGAVGLIVSIDAQGHVVEVSVERSLSPELDEAARRAVREFVFKPARRNGTPIPARVRYEYRFAAPAPVVVAEPSPAVLTGRVLDDTSGAPVPGADLSITAKDGRVRSAATDANGVFVFEALPAGEYDVQIVALEHGPSSAHELLAPGEKLELAYRLRTIDRTARTDFGATARIEAPQREIVKRSVAPEELVRMAGTRGDALRTVELLPGVARPPAGEGMVIVRGSAPGDSEVFIDGAPVYNLYHFGGLTSVVNGFLLKGIDLYPGNFSARFGRKIGAVIETNFRDPRADRVRGILDVNTIDASLLVETPITEQLSLAVAARRSYLDAWFKPLVESSDLNVRAAPVYYDYQAILNWKPTTRDKLRLIGYGSFDELTLLVDGGNEQDPSAHGKFGSRNSFHRGQLEWHRDMRADIDSDFMVAAGPVLAAGQMGPDLGFEVRGFDVISRGELHLRARPWLRTNLGFDAQVIQTQMSYRGPKAQQSEGDPGSAGPITGKDTLDLDETATFTRPALYGELILSPHRRLELTTGIRLDYFGEIKGLSVDPRFNARVFLGDTTLRAGVGLFSQPPDYTQTLAGYGNPDLDPVRAIHVGAGVEQRLSPLAVVSLDGFYKDLSNLVVNSPDQALINRGDGRIYGLELMGRLNPGGRCSGFLSYTLSRSERNDKDGTGTRLFDYDQTHILTASGNVKLGSRGWLIGSTFRLTSGNPYTPVTSGLYNANHDFYSPLYGATNSRRSGYFHRLDVRVEKRWAIGEKGSGITAYLDVQNLYNHQNPEGIQYNFNYARSKDQPGLPILPSIGLRGEL